MRSARSPTAVMRIARLGMRSTRAVLSVTALVAACGSEDDGDDPQSRGQDAAAPVDAALADAAVSMVFDASQEMFDAQLSDARDELDAGNLDAAESDSDDASEAPPSLPEHCATATTPPAGLECTGLYVNVETKEIFPGVNSYTPAFVLWSDGADKDRWISLPEGETIDNSDRNEWVFPVGTKLFKEFSKDGKRVETRMWHKAANNFWVNATYAWNEDESEAKVSAGGDITLGDGSSYHIPTQDECEKCHRGRTERILGFDQVLLGLAGAKGITLETLVDDGLLSENLDSIDLSIGDDGSGLAPNALGWLHANCGITCHNGNSRAVGYPTGLRLRLDPADLDGGSVADFDAYATAVGVSVTTVNWLGQTRIVPGSPEQSWLYHLITTRGQGTQMPPFATSEVDVVNSALIGEWIRQMPRVDAGSASESDAGGIGGGPPIGPIPDAGFDNDGGGGMGGAPPGPPGP